MIRRVVVWTATAAMFVMLAGCGGGGQSPLTTTTTTTAPTATTVAPATTTTGGGGSSTQPPDTTPGGPAPGTMTLDGQTYDITVTLCNQPEGPGSLGISGQVLAPTPSTFGGGGALDNFLLSVQLGPDSYMAMNIELTRDGNTYSYEGPIDRVPGGGQVPISIRFGC